MPNRCLTLEEIHAKSLDILFFLDDFCKTHQLRYYLAYGTLLGAVRHDGFIPWDDDVDIWMRRKDYDETIRIFKETNYMIGPFKLLCRFSDSLYNYPIIRITDMRYKYCPTDTSIYPDMGTFIDIYPLDSISSQEKFETVYRKIGRYNWLYAVSCDWRGTTWYKTIVKKIVHLGIKIIWGKSFLQYVENKCNDIIRKCSSEEGQYYGVLNWFTTGLKIYKKEYFENAVKHTFEGLLLDIPKQYHELLTVIYVDYMKLPPEDMRVQYHNYSIKERVDNESTYS